MVSRSLTRGDPKMSKERVSKGPSNGAIEGDSRNAMSTNEKVDEEDEGEYMADGENEGGGGARM